MDSKARQELAWSYQEPDRVPIEIELSSHARQMPEAARIVEFVDHEADNFLFAPLFNWGFLGLDAEYREEVIKDVPGDFKRLRRTYSTAVGDFVGITKHRYAELDPADFHWEQRYVHTLDDMVRLAEAPRSPRAFNQKAHEDGLARNGTRGLSMTGLWHPLGVLVRWSNLDEVYAWMATEKKILHRYLERANQQVIASVLAMEGTGMRPIFATWALEMMMPPWLGRRGFEEFVFPYDKSVNDAIHRIGGRHRAHSHGRCGAYLERFAEMGIDSTEPLEPPPYGDCDLAQAKRTVGRRMLLSGNILSQNYLNMTVGEVREVVRQAIRIGAPGGGFTLKCAEGTGGTVSAKDLDQVRACLPRIQAYIDAALEFGRYPIRC